MVKLILFSFVFFTYFLCYVLAKPVKIEKYENLKDGCLCENFTCNCCADLIVPQIWLNDTICILFGYDPKEYGISFVLTLDGKALINETISATNPPPICFPVPLIEDFVDGCVHFYDISISNEKFHGCAQIELRMWWIYVVAEYKLGCFDADNMSKKYAKILNFLSKTKSMNETEIISYNKIKKADSMKKINSNKTEHAKILNFMSKTESMNETEIISFNKIKNAKYYEKNFSSKATELFIHMNNEVKSWATKVKDFKFFK